MRTSKIHLTVVCHVQPKIMAVSLIRLMATAGEPIASAVFIDNFWPIDREETSRDIETLAKAYGAAVTRPAGGRNIGGHQGGNLAIDFLRPVLQRDDLILGFDPDSFPLDYGWLAAAKTVMLNSDLDSVSLIHTAIINRPWQFQIINGIKVGSLPFPEMYNVTVWRAGWLLDNKLAGSGFYGHVESALHHKNKHGYLLEYAESHHPIPHPEIYVEWKRVHASGEYKGNFDQFVVTTKSPLLNTTNMATR